MAHLIYICRLCGEPDKGVHGPEELIFTAFLQLVTTGQSAGKFCKMTTTHSCPDGRSGIADLVGMSKESDL